MSAPFCSTLKAIDLVLGGSMPFEASKLTNSVTVDLDCHAMLNSLIQRRDL